jgi:hypothetical protein
MDPMKYLILVMLFSLSIITSSTHGQVTFPSSQPQDGNFNRPLPNQELDVSPPGFCWWRAAPRGEVHYQLHIEEASGNSIYKSGLLLDPVHVPDEVLKEGKYRWHVDAFNKDGMAITTRQSDEFSISPNALELPWIDPKELLSRIPAEHPRLLFPKAKLSEIRANLHDTRRDAYEDLKKVADQALELDIMVKPDYDKYDIQTEYPARRTAYRASYHEFTRVYNRGMVPMALMYLLSGEEKYGIAAKKHLLNLLDWELDEKGVASLVESFDEVGLRIARTSAQGYDWLYDILSEEEREAVKQMLLARGDQMLARMERRDFLHKSAYSHDGRLPGYLVEFSLALAEEERAEVWMDYAMRALLTVFPHWGGIDGGWAEGINYVLSYNERFITPLQSLYEATGYDLWKKSYFRKMRHFLMYCVSPMGEITPFGDAEHNAVKGRAGDIYSILQFHALHYEDPATRWWIEQLDSDKENTARLGAMHRIIHEDNLKSEIPESIPQDIAFNGVGWAALHSDILNPENDLMILFKSSPYGSVSHSHADQNGFAIMKGGKALANPSGARYPQHQSPFHFEYTNLTVAHNTLLINGKGQIDRSASANGRIVDFKSTAHLGYVAGDAQKCYGDQLDYYKRHVIMIRPSVILIIDDLSGPEPFSVDWLMHGREEMILDKHKQQIISSRKGESMKTQLITPGKLNFAMTNEWPFDPKKDYPMVTAPRPVKEWHFSASTASKSRNHRIAAIMLVKENDQYPECALKEEDNQVHLSGQFSDESWSGIIRMSDNDRQPLLVLEYHPASGEKETIRIERK